MSETTSGLPSVEDVRDELCGWPIGGGYYQSKVGADEAREMAIAMLALFEAAVPRIKAEALHSAAVAWWTLNRIDEEGGVDLGDMAGPVSDFVNLTTDEWLHERADHTEAAGR